MLRLAPYQSGLWLAEYVNVRCQLCRVYRSTPQSQSPLSATDVTNISTSLFSSLQHGFLRKLDSGLLCQYCHNSIAWLPDVFEVDIAAGKTLPIQAATYYDYPIRQAIGAFKHHEDMTKLPLLLHTLRQLPRPHGCHYDNSVIIAMPTTDQRLKKRGFDPVSILSAQLSKHWQIPLWHGVQRIDNTFSQQGLTRAERLTNLNDAFALTKTPKVKRLLLFDDVATTGASLQALGRVFYDQSSIAAGAPTNINAHDAYHLSAFTLAHGNQ